MRDSRDRTIGIVDYATKDDMKYALRKLDDTEFKNPFDRWGSYLHKQTSAYQTCWLLASPHLLLNHASNVTSSRK
jgi:hypothetical protein